MSTITAMTALEAANAILQAIQISDNPENCMGKDGGFEGAAELLWNALPSQDPSDLLWFAGFRAERGCKKLVEPEPEHDPAVRRLLVLGRHGKHNNQWWARVAIHEEMKKLPTAQWLELAKAMQAAGDAILAEYRASNQPKKTPNKTGYRRDGESVNDAMMRQFVRDKRCVDWSLGTWANLLGCSKPAVKKTPAWTAIMNERQERKAALRKGGYIR